MIETDKMLLAINKYEDLLECRRNELVPKNQFVKENGVEGLITYRCMKNGIHPDSLLTNPATYWISKKLYKIIPDSQDTIFNCWSLIKIYDAVHSGNLNTRDDEAILKSIKSGDEIIKQEHKETFNILADRQHCIANFMPAPKGFNGWKNKFKNHPGKGEYTRDNDFPDIYYLRAEKEFPEMYKWINCNLERYSLQVFHEKITPWKDKEAHFQGMKTKPSEDTIFQIAKTMNTLLEFRAETIFKKSLSQNDNSIYTYPTNSSLSD